MVKYSVAFLFVILSLTANNQVSSSSEIWHLFNEMHHSLKVLATDYVQKYYEQFMTSKSAHGALRQCVIYCDNAMVDADFASKSFDQKALRNETLLYLAACNDYLQRCESYLRDNRDEVHDAAAAAFDDILGYIDGPEATIQKAFDLGMEYALEWLAPVDLAYVALTSSAMAAAVRNETLRRTRDVSRGTEAFPVPVFNSVDNCRYPYFEYAPASLPARPGNGRTFRWGKCFSQDSAFYLKEFGSDGCCCINCSQGFSSHDNYLHEENSPKRRKLSTCPCGRTIQGDPAYDSESRLTQEYTGEQLSLIYECGAACMCDLSCRHRTTQRGLAVRANLVRHPKKGWCLHAAENIKTGTFICEYAGELLTTKEAQRRHSIYDKERKNSALLVVREHLPSGACLRLNIDATNVGNVARFMNHSCDSGNLFSFIVRSAGCYIPRLVFFAKKNILEGEELTFSYGGVEEGSNTHPCFCGTPECIGMLPSERT